MSTNRKILLAIATVALGTTALAGASLADDERGYRGGARAMEQFDANQDGAITQAEIDQVRRDRLAAFDQNGDGSLTLEEYQALWLDAMHARMVDRFQELDGDGDAIVTVEEFVRPYGSMVDRLDRNGDGQISRDEMRGPHHGRGGRYDDDDDDDRHGSARQRHRQGFPV